MLISEIVDQLEEDLMVIAINMSHQAGLSATKQRVFLRHVNKYVKDLSIVFPQEECKCRKWIIKDKWRGSHYHLKQIQILRNKLRVQCEQR
jgi:hypothetical protein